MGNVSAHSKKGNKKLPARSFNAFLLFSTFLCSVRTFSALKFKWNHQMSFRYCNDVKHVLVQKEIVSPPRNSSTCSTLQDGHLFFHSPFHLADCPAVSFRFVYLHDNQQLDINPSVKQLSCVINTISPKLLAFTNLPSGAGCVIVLKSNWDCVGPGLTLPLCVYSPSKFDYCLSNLALAKYKYRLNTENSCSVNSLIQFLRKLITNGKLISYKW